MRNKNIFVISVALLVLPFASLAQDYYLQPEKVSYGAEVLYTASNTIYSVTDASFIVESGGRAELKAGNRIELNPGFQVLNGGMLVAILEVIEPTPPGDKESVSVFPNPTDGMINVVSPNVVDAARLLDMNGFSIVEQMEISAAKFSMDLTSVKEGIYILEIISGKDIQQIRLERK